MDPALFFCRAGPHTEAVTLDDQPSDPAFSGLSLESLEARLAARDGEAAFILANWLMAGERIPRNLHRARDLFRQAAEAGIREAEAPLVALLANGAGGQSRHWIDAVERFADAAKSQPALRAQSECLAQMAIDDTGEPAGDFTPQFLSHDPLIVRYPEFMTAAECDAVIAMSQPLLRSATVVDPRSGALVRDPVRDSSTAAFPFLCETPFLHAINRRIAAASRSTYEQGEPTQVLHYAPGQQYKLHSDAIPRATNQRIQTFLVYLNDDFAGGATFFPQANLRLRPPRGTAVCFSNVTADMRPSPNAVHSGEPVTSGTKMVLSKWIRRYPLDLRTGAA